MPGHMREMTSIQWSPQEFRDTMKMGSLLRKGHYQCRACLREVISTTISKANRAGLFKSAEITPTPLCGIDAGHGATRFDICLLGLGLVWCDDPSLVFYTIFLNMNAYCFIIGWEYVILYYIANLSALMRWVALLSYAFFAKGSWT